MIGGLHPRYENARLWLARLFYGLACRLCRQELNPPWDPSAPSEFHRLQAWRMERVAKEWKQKHADLRKRIIEERRPRHADF